MLVTEALEMIPLSSRLRLHNRPAMVHSLRSTLKSSLLDFSEASESSTCSASEVAGGLDTRELVSEAIMRALAAFETIQRVESLYRIRLMQSKYTCTWYNFHHEDWGRTRHDA